jgi:hypothetical protein
MQAGAYGGLHLAKAAGFHPLAIFAFIAAVVVTRESR